MSKWMHTLNIATEWKASNDDESLVYKTAEAIVRKLKAFHIQDDSALEAVIENFDDIASNPESGYDEFNYCMTGLYDWADIKLDNNWNGRANCWIERG